MKIRLKPDAELDPETLAVLASARKTAAEVALWPAWKRGLPPCADEKCERELGHEGRHRRARTEHDEW